MLDSRLCLLRASYMLGLLLNPEDGGSTFLSNVGVILLD
jgi:hypothetical protein